MIHAGGGKTIHSRNPYQTVLAILNQAQKSKGTDNIEVSLRWLLSLVGNLGMEDVSIDEAARVDFLQVTVIIASIFRDAPSPEMKHLAMQCLAALIVRC